ncbi:MAG: flagellar basal body P-ring formation chaperone FlgA [Bacteroidota bacterium]|nr:flagellar basal body P-ring formation chaperone FlgA [Bacteroidota bacterium]MDP4190175.1 flagellar basal body P-ring formation chaperone FlgA [Bacteroidota bacterium]MDP4193774.1 flagellar basal body P-ring formation chaperone FlgA [Bacteroidota bacterium]
MRILLLIFSFLFAAALQADPILQKNIENYLKEQLKGYEKFEFELVSSPATKPSDKISIDQDRQFRLSGNMAYVPVKIYSIDGRNSSSSLLSVRVKLYKMIFVATTAIKYGTELKESNFVQKLSDVAQLRGLPVEDLKEISSTKSKFNIREGDILTKESIQPLPLIRNGEKVVAIFSSGNLSITLDAAARQDGAKGDIIRIVTPDKKLFKAKVVDENSVIIQE